MLNSNTIRQMFPDWKTLEPTEWSAHTIFLRYALDGIIEVGLYRESIEEGYEYSGTYTLQIFDNDEVIFCARVDDERSRHE